MAEKDKNFEPKMTGIRAVPPGEILREELKERNIRQKDFAETIGMGSSHLSELINGTRRFSLSTAMRLEEQLGISAVIWMNLQTQYEYDRRVIEERKRETKREEASGWDADELQNQLKYTGFLAEK